MKPMIKISADVVCEDFFLTTVEIELPEDVYLIASDHAIRNQLREEANDWLNNNYWFENLQVKKEEK